jgi:hypothetical protein
MSALCGPTGFTAQDRAHLDAEAEQFKDPSSVTVLLLRLLRHGDGSVGSAAVLNPGII